MNIGITMQWKMKKVAGIGYFDRGTMRKKKIRVGLCMDFLLEPYLRKNVGSELLIVSSIYSDVDIF